MPHILILEDEPAIAESLSFVLQRESFSTHWESLGAAALHYLRTHAVDLVIMDVGLPDMSGFEACKLLRGFSAVPVIFLTARSEEMDRVVGLEIGADDYVVKPFSPREVAARVKAILRRASQPALPVPILAADQADSLVSPNDDGDFTIDLHKMCISFIGVNLNLTPVEFKLLHILLAQPEHVFSRDQLLTAIGVASDAGYERSIDTHIKTLRAKLRGVSDAFEPIQTQRGFGYSYQPRAR